MKRVVNTECIYLTSQINIDSKYSRFIDSINPIRAKKANMKLSGPTGLPNCALNAIVFELIEVYY